MTQNNAAPFKAVLEATHIDIAINKKTIIHDLSLAIPEGKITAIIGPNGCGKSTTLKAIARILPCAKGSISFLGKDIHSLSHREFARCLAILTQSPVAPTDLTVQDLVEMGRFPHRSFLGRGDKDDAQHVAWALEQTNMTSMSHRLLHTLSGGERQRAWIAMALAQRRDLAIIGRYLLTPEIFQILENQEPGAGNEIQLTDAIDTLNKTQRVFAREFKGRRYDVGDKFGFMKTSIDYALKHPQVKDDLKQYIINLGKQLEESGKVTEK